MTIAIAVASARVPAWHAWCIAALRAVPGVEVRVVRVDGAPWSPPPRAFAFAAGAALAPAIVELDGGRLAADVVLDLTGGQPPAGDVHAERWIFALADSQDATLPFAREIARGARTFEVTLLRIVPGGGERLGHGTFGVAGWYGATLRLALAQAARWPAIVAAARVRGERDSALAVAPIARPRPLEGLRRVAFAAALMRRLAAKLAADLLEVTEWNVGIVRAEPAALLRDAPLSVRWLPRPKRASFIADPFAVEHDGRCVVFVEQYEESRGRGVIDALELDAQDRVVRRERALELPSHLSYPYPLRIEGELFFVPESCSANEVALYRCVDFPARWEREATLFADFDGVDTTIFAHEGRWWAMCTRFSEGDQVALYAFHAAGPRGPWTPHARNPIVCDVSRARPAGQPFTVDGALYRPGQDCSTSYGGGIALARVEALTPTSYRETVVRRLDARAFGRWRDGVHTVSFAGDRIVLDAKRTTWDLRRLRHSVPEMARLLARRGREAPPA